MVNIINNKRKPKLTKVDIHVKIENMGLDMKVESLEHLYNILTYQHEELGKNIIGKLVVSNDNKED